MSSDEPTALLGTDSAVPPAEYPRQTLAGCYTVTLAALAAERGIELKAYHLSWRAISTSEAFSASTLRSAPAFSRCGVRLHVDAPGPRRAAR
ncbi:OsmC family protein [Streptomyces sp. NPDC088812]|uniref:OsmC family protein n=1 Tax=Streptomyces sp. NPDC088812 TaxID=3365905 RepID=UPI0037F3D825